MADPDPSLGNVTPRSALAVPGRYADVSEVGRGGMGIVYRARDSRTGDVVALKVLRPEFSVDAAVLERFKSELLLARRITHKNVCRVYELVDLGGLSAISMEFVEGDSLRELLKRFESLSIRFGMKMLGQILAGLAEAHAQGVVHRDLKPENILISRDGVVKVMDFGIARASDSRATSTGTAIGTPAYMSPEQIEGRPADARSDIYSLGLVMFEMFCGQPAFSHPSPFGVIAKHAHETPPAPREIDAAVPPRLERAILRCLEKDPAKRFQSMTELHAALVDDPAATPPPRPIVLSAPQTTWQRRDAWLVVAGVLGAAAFALLFQQTSLAARTPVTFDSGALRQIVQQHAARLNAGLTGEAQTRASAYVKEYWYLLRAAGAEETHRLARESLPIVVWKVTYTGGPSFQFDARGRLVSFSRNVVSSDAAALPASDARVLAAAKVRDFFGISASALELEREGTVGGATTISWKDPQAPYGLVHRYLVVLEGGETSVLSNTYQFPSALSLPWLAMETWYTPVSLAVVLLLVAIGVRRRDRIELTARWRIALAIAGFMATFAEAWGYVAVGLEPGSRWAVALGIGFTAAVLWLLMSAAAEDRVRRIDPVRMATMTMLFGRGVLTPACGLALLRGTVIGLALLGLDAALVWLVTTHLGGYPDPDMSVWFLGLGLEYRSMVVALAGAVIQMLWLGSFVSFATSQVMLHARRWWTVVAIPALVLTLIGGHFSMAAVQPYYWTVSVLLVNYVVLVATFRRYDLLTLFTAIFTFSFVWGAYMMYLALEPSGASAPALTLILWMFAVVFAAGIAFRYRIVAAFRSITAALD
jgi:hypothetical protein